VNRISRDELDALHHSDADFVAAVAFSAAGLPRCVGDDDVLVRKEPPRISCHEAFQIVFRVPVKVTIRLDKMLARELGLSRRIAEAIAEPKVAFRKPVRDGLRVTIRWSAIPVAVCPTRSAC
jgi:hypothetical protein